MTRYQIWKLNFIFQCHYRLLFPINMKFIHKILTKISKNNIVRDQGKNLADLTGHPLHLHTGNDLRTRHTWTARTPIVNLLHDVALLVLRLVRNRVPARPDPQHLSNLSLHLSHRDIRVHVSLHLEKLDGKNRVRNKHEPHDVRPPGRGYRGQSYIDEFRPAGLENNGLHGGLYAEGPGVELQQGFSAIGGAELGLQSHAGGLGSGQVALDLGDQGVLAAHVHFLEAQSVAQGVGQVGQAGRHRLGSRGEDKVVQGRYAVGHADTRLLVPLLAIGTDFHNDSKGKGETAIETGAQSLTVGQNRGEEPQLQADEEPK